MEKQKPMPHLGDFVRSLTYKKGHTGASLAKLIGKSQNTVTGYSTEPSLHARILWDISQALKFDIFEHLSNELNLDGATDKAVEAKSKQQRIYDLELLVRDLQKEVAIYKDLLKR